MRKNQKKIPISLNSIKDGLELCIYEEHENSLFKIEEQEADDNAESPFQLLEGRGYSYDFSDSGFRLEIVSGVVTSYIRNKIYQGRITPNIFVGSLSLKVLDDDKNHLETVYVEVLSSKLDFLKDNQEVDDDYRKNYRNMLKYIADKCSELIMQVESPVDQNFEPDFDKNSSTIYQRFAFVKSLIASDEFNDAINRIVHTPSTIWKEESELMDIRKTKRFTNNVINQLTSGSNRTKYQINERINSIPSKITNSVKVETVDTPENRFIKFVLEKYLKFCEDCNECFLKEKYKKAAKESEALIFVLQNYLENPFFKQISRPNALILNSPILQRKSGYREVLIAWIQFDIAAKLIWHGGEKIYKAGKRDIAILYEYWLFFQLYFSFVSNPKYDFTELKYDDKKIDHLIESTKGELGLKLKSGVDTSIFGYYKSVKRKLRFRFSYNRTFVGNREYEQNDNLWSVKAGSWTKGLRPDYTLSFWPSSIDEVKAENEDLIVHIHFDAKYKVKHFTDYKKNDESKRTEVDGEELDELEIEKIDERKGIYKNADLMKMHAYKDAIRRTGGAYVLYPGEGEVAQTNSKYKGFHELIPGLGAFAVRPNVDDEGIAETGIDNVKDFIEEVVNHLIDQATQRENIAVKSYEIHKDRKSDNDSLMEPVPEYFDASKMEKIIPIETSVLIGYYKKDGKHLKWVEEKLLYNIRYAEKYGLTSKEVEARYLLLYSKDETETSLFFKIKSNVGPKLYSKNELKGLGYPTVPSELLYLVYELEKVVENEFLGITWDLSKFSNLKKGGRPVSVSLEELMKKIKKT